MVFFCRFASGGSASTDFYCENEKRVQKRCKIDWFFDVSKQAIAQAPIFTVQKSILGTPADLPETRHEAWCTTPGTLAPEVRMTIVLNKLPQITVMLGFGELKDL